MKKLFNLGTYPDLHQLVRDDDKENLLLELNVRPFRIFEKDSLQGMTLIEWACEYGRNSILEMVLQKGANVNYRSGKGRTPLHIACFHGHTDTVKLLLHHGANIDACNSDGGTPLHMGVYNGHEDVIFELLNRGAKVDIQENHYGVTPLHLACQKGFHGIALALVENLASLKVTDKVCFINSCNSTA
jgi:ankyrin repeat protein